MKKLAATAFIIVLFLQSTSYASEIDWKKGKWSHLVKYIGTYNVAAVLNDKQVHDSLVVELGDHELSHLINNLDVHGPFGFDRDCLTLDGNARHQGGEENGFLDICIYDGKVHAAILSKGDIQIFSPYDRYSYLPYGMQMWINFVLRPQPWSTEIPSHVHFNTPKYGSPAPPPPAPLP